jgi:lipopolysaccharide export system protein LptC
MNDRIALALPVVALALLAALSAWLNHLVQGGPAERVAPPDEPGFVVENFVATTTGQDGRPRAILRAQRLLHYPHDDTTHLVRPQSRQYDDRRVPLSASADRALVSSDGRDIHLHGNVLLVRGAHGERGELRLRTDYLHLIPDRGLARTDRAVLIEDANSRIEAVGLEFDHDARTLRLLSRVRSVFRPVEGRTPVRRGVVR